MFYNTFYLLTLMWALHARDSEEPVLVAGIVNIIAILMDIITLASYYPVSHDSSFSVL